MIDTSRHGGPTRAARSAIDRPQTLGEEIANAVSHGLGVLLAIASLPILVWHAARAGGAIDVALVDASTSPDDGTHVTGGPDVLRRIEARGIRALSADLVDPADPMRHDPDRLIAALAEVW